MCIRDRDGTVFYGKSAGMTGTATGEICFNTGMTGYQEVFTDPSYYGQLMITTNAHIGNYGIHNFDNQSDSIKIAGLITKNFSFNFSYISIMLFFTGIVTIIPLFFFNLGLRYTTLGLAGVLFYIAPSFHFITSVLILDENLEIEKIAAFIIIWIGVSVFIYDAVRKKKLS